MAKRKRGDAVETSLLVEWLQQREDEMAALLAELVAIPTENPPGQNYRACADLLENRVKQAALGPRPPDVPRAKATARRGPACLGGRDGRAATLRSLPGPTRV